MTDRSADYEHDRRRHQPRFECWFNESMDVVKQSKDLPWMVIKHMSCKECHGTGWSEDGSRPCEHP